VLLPEDPTPVALSDTENTSGRGCQGLGCVLSWVKRRSYRQAVKSYSLVATEMEERTGMGPDLILFGWWSFPFNQEW
jgi:hypothetical protein